ncbi:hypothetical protein PILCRDRAFT_14478 [Piloderma croceum F 1598]|uniref:DUF7918 domain-containing protein n=1 Tax=Piloderma croceum (strain F 1598) TaxID=765440 RepID=A0A0C3EP16_PILCF|nr:hypothetical protein PILCRDRAFT_14478 [Piloderma croceum F 1598]
MPLQSKAWISIGDTELDAFNIEATNDGKKEFAVNWTRPRIELSTMMSVQVKVDGVDCTGRLMKPGKNVVFNKSAFSTSHTTIKPFLFGDLQLTTMTLFWTSLPRQILVQLQRRKLLGYHSNYGPPPTEQKVHERAKKATVHRVTLGEEVQRRFKKLARTELLDKDQVITFVFNYRPLDVLKANGIVPSNVGHKRRVPADLEPENVKQEINGVADADAARMKALEDELETLRKLTSSSKSNPAKRMKLEPLVPKGFVSGEVIDLP